MLETMAVLKAWETFYVIVGAHPARALFDIGGAALLLLPIGLHNVWDTPTWVLMDSSRPRQTDAEETG